MDVCAAACRAMAMEPNRPGVARLCQELLAHAFELGLMAEPAVQRVTRGQS